MAQNKTPKVPGLGDEVIDKVTGFKGIVTSVAKCLNGCDRATVQPPMKKDGSLPDSIWIDIPQLTLVKAGKYAVKSDQERVNGGPPARSTVHKRF